MSKEDVPLSNLFVELSELEESTICGGFTPARGKISLPETEDNITSNFSSFTLSNDNQLSVIENFNIDNYLNNLSGSSTFSLNVDTTISSSIFISSDSSIQTSSSSEIFNILPAKNQQELAKLLDNNAINNFALSITRFSANIQGTETFSILGPTGSISTSSTFSLNIDTAAVSGIFFSEQSSKLDISNLFPDNNASVGMHPLEKNTTLGKFGLSFTYYSADFERTNIYSISGLSGSAFASFTESVNIDTESLSGIFLPQQTSTPFIFGRNKQAIANIESGNISNSLIIRDSLPFSEQFLLSLNTTSGITGSSADLFAFSQTFNSHSFGVAENNFTDSFGFSTSSFNAQINNAKSYRTSGNFGSTEELVNSILGITPNNTENIQSFSSSGFTLDLSINLSSNLFRSIFVNTSINSGLDSRLAEFNNLSNFNYLSSSEVLLEDISVQENGFNFMLGGSSFNSQLKRLDDTSIQLRSVNLLEGIQDFTSEAEFPQTINSSDRLFLSQSSINTLTGTDKPLTLVDAGIGSYSFFNSDIFKFDTNNANFGSIDRNIAQNSTNNLPADLKSIGITKNNIMHPIFLLFSASNSKETTLLLDRSHIQNLPQKSDRRIK